MHICCIYTYIFYILLCILLVYIYIFHPCFLYFIFYSRVFSLLVLLLLRQISPWGLIKYLSIYLILDSRADTSLFTLNSISAKLISAICTGWRSAHLSHGAQQGMSSIRGSRVSKSGERLLYFAKKYRADANSLPWVTRLMASGVGMKTWGEMVALR